MLWGPPGVGKTARLLQIAEKNNLHAEVVVGSLREPSDFAGLPVIQADGSVCLAAPAWARRLAEAGEKGMLILDELTTSTPAVQAAMLRVVLDRVVGDVSIEKARVVAAGNPPDCAAGGWDLAAPLANRFSHVDVSVSLDEWIMWASSVEGKNAKTLSAICGFLQRSRDSLFDLPKEDTDRSRAWPSPRSWEMASKLLATFDKADWGKDDALDSIASSVGHPTAVKWIQWMKSADLPDPEELIANPMGWDIPIRGDLVWASMTSVCSTIRSNNTAPRWMAGWKLIGRIADKYPDIGAGVGRIMAAVPPPKGARGPSEIKELQPIMKAAGLI